MAKTPSSKARSSKAPTRKKVAKKVSRSALPQKAARAALDRATADIKRLQKSAAKNAWAIGDRLGQIAELELHKARGFVSIEAYAEEKLSLSRDTAFLYMRVAQAFSETVVGTFGPEKLDRALRYIAATPEPEAPGDIPELRIRVPAEDGGEVTNKRFAEVTISDLRRAVRAERAAQKKGAREPRPPKWLDEGAAGALDRGHRALGKAVGRTAAKSAGVHVRRTGDDVVIDVRGVPLERAAGAFRALATALASS